MPLSGNDVQMVRKCHETIFQTVGNPSIPSGVRDAEEIIAPVKRIGAVSPAALATCRITPVNIPLIELGSTIVRIVCHLVAPMFQHATRNDMGTDANASLVLVIITGSVMTATVHDAANRQRSIPRKYTNAQAKQTMHDTWYTSKIDDCQIYESSQPVIPRKFVEVYAGQDSNGSSNQQRDQYQKEGTNQGSPDTASGHTDFRVFRHKLHRERAGQDL